MTVSFGDIMPEVHPEMAYRFVHRWHSERPGQVIITRISSAGHHVVRSWAFTADAVQESFTPEGLAVLCADQGGNWNVYVSCSQHREDPTGAAGRKRGGRHTIDEVLGVWLDLDVKDESFASGDEIDIFLKTLPFEPTVVVDSGSGGRHAYWRFGAASVTRDEGERLNEAWWSYIQELAGSVYVDKTTSSDRIMRLPGTIRWPKGEERPAPVALLKDDGPRVDIERLWVTCEPSFQRLAERRVRIRSNAQASLNLAKVSLEEIRRKVGWDRLLALAQFEELFNNETSWDQILIPHGWINVGEDSEGRRHWGRPGQRGKSAHTDYPLSPHVMKLFSNSPDTGLADLNDADVPLTKFRVHAQLAYGGDVDALVREVLRERKED